MAADPNALSRRRVLGLGAGAAAAAVLAGCSLNRGSTPNNDAAKPDQGWDSTLLDPPFEKADLTFTALDGSPYSLREETAGKLTLLFFGFTHCPDVCPVTLNTLARAKEAIGTGPGSRPLVLFVGVDTKRDTPEAMTTYLDNIDPAFVGLTGSPELMDEALASIKAAPVVFGEPDADGEYDVGHYGGVVAYSPDDLGHRLYAPNTRQQTWTKELPRLDEGTFS